jgi:hypothetical protein
MTEQRDPERGDHSRKDYGKDSGFWLIPRRPLIALAKVYAIGAAKYAPRGWEAGMEWSRVVDPLFRHLLKWMTGEKYDPVDGQHHLASVAWAALTLMEYETTHPELDDLARDRIAPEVTQLPDDIVDVEPGLLRTSESIDPRKRAHWQTLGGYTNDTIADELNN